MRYYVPMPKSSVKLQEIKKEALRKGLRHTDIWAMIRFSSKDFENVLLKPVSPPISSLQIHFFNEDWLLRVGRRPPSIWITWNRIWKRFPPHLSTSKLAKLLQHFNQSDMVLPPRNLLHYCSNEDAIYRFVHCFAFRVDNFPRNFFFRGRLLNTRGTQRPSTISTWS